MCKAVPVQYDYISMFSLHYAMFPFPLPSYSSLSLPLSLFIPFPFLFSFLPPFSFLSPFPFFSRNMAQYLHFQIMLKFSVEISWMTHRARACGARTLCYESLWPFMHGMFSNFLERSSFIIRFLMHVNHFICKVKVS